MTVEPQPAPSHVTAAEVATWLGLDDTDTHLTLVTSAANALVSRYAGAEVTDATRAAGVMLAARLHRRRNSPEGVQSLGVESVAYVARTDPDIARLLRIDSFDPPAVG